MKCFTSLFPLIRWQIDNIWLYKFVKCISFTRIKRYLAVISIKNQCQFVNLPIYVLLLKSNEQ